MTRRYTDLYGETLRAERHGWQLIEWYNGGALLWHHNTRWGLRLLYCGDECVTAERV